MNKAIHATAGPVGTTLAPTAFVHATRARSRARRVQIRGPCRSRRQRLAGIGAITGAILLVAGDKSVAQTSDNPQKREFGSWTYHVVQNPLEGEEFSQIYTSADSVSTRNEAALAIRCRNNQVRAVLFTNRHFRASDRIQLRYQVDGKRAVTVRWRFVRNEAVLMSPTGDYVSKFIAALKGAKKLTVRISNDEGVLMRSRYVVGGFDQAIIPINMHCGL